MNTIGHNKVPAVKFTFDNDIRFGKALFHIATLVAQVAGNVGGTFELVAEFAARRKNWKPKDHGYGSGALWKYAQQVGPAVSGAVTHPGGSAEGVCYADI